MGEMGGNGQHRSEAAREDVLKMLAGAKHASPSRCAGQIVSFVEHCTPIYFSISMSSVRSHHFIQYRRVASLPHARFARPGQKRSHEAAGSLHLQFHLETAIRR